MTFDARRQGLLHLFSCQIGYCLLQLFRQVLGPSGSSIVGLAQLLGLLWQYVERRSVRSGRALRVRLQVCIRL